MKQINCSAAPARVVVPTSAAEVGEFRHDFLNGYLPPSDRTVWL